MAADGFDSGFGEVGEAAWRGYVADVVRRLGITPGATVFEVGCGAGAFLLPLAEAGCTVAGLDASERLIGFASAALPEARLSVGEAAALDPGEPADFVVSNGVFLYFPSAEYAADVLAKMGGKAQKGLAILDVPDLDRRDEALAMRRGFLSPGEYEARYAGLDHLYLPRGWFTRRLAPLGFSRVEISDQSIPDYPNGQFRYNVLARRD
jgi:trans-aconitate methyltransferase